MSLNLNFHQLRIFFLCGQHRTFSEAAEALFLTQPAVTMQMKQLETYLGLELFHRQGKIIDLTESGRILFEYAQKIFDLAESAENALQSLRDLKSGVLRVGTLKIYARFMMSALISAYQERYPDIHVILDEGSSMEITRSLIENKNEIGLISAVPPFPRQLEVVPHFQEELVLVMASNHPLSKKRQIYMTDLANEFLIIRESGSLSREIILEKFREAGITPRILTEAKNLAFIIEQVQAGKGISFIAEWALKDQLARGSLKICSLVEGPFLINVDIAYRKNRVPSPAARALIDLLIERKNARTSDKSANLSGKG